VAEHCGLEADAIVGLDLVAADTQPPALGGADGMSVTRRAWTTWRRAMRPWSRSAPAEPGDATQVIVANDHEEVGSGSAEDASGPFLEDTLPRGRGSRRPRPPGVGPCHVAVDAGVGRHGPRRPSAARHEGEHRPRLGGGPVIKVNAEPVVRLGCRLDRVVRGPRPRRRDPSTALRGARGSTVRVDDRAAHRDTAGVQTVDVGSPVLSMHSVREQAHAADIGPTIATVRAHLTTSA
jgi:aspartyl aminopeptidase